MAEHDELIAEIEQACDDWQHIYGQPNFAPNLNLARRAAAALGEADAENARLREGLQHVAPSASGQWVVLSWEQYAGGQTADEAQDSFDEVDALQAKLDALKALIAPMWRPLDYDRNALIDDLRAILNGEEPK